MLILRHGCVKVAVLSIITAGLGYLISAVATDFFVLYISYGILYGMFIFNAISRSVSAKAYPSVILLSAKSKGYVLVIKQI